MFLMLTDIEYKVVTTHQWHCWSNLYARLRSVSTSMTSMNIGLSWVIDSQESPSRSHNMKTDNLYGYIGWYLWLHL